MRKFFLLVFVMLFSRGLCQDSPTATSSSTFKEGPNARAVFLNPNVYKSRVSLKGLIVGKEGTNRTYKDTVIINIAENSKRFDYKIVNEDLNGFAIIQVLPRVKFVKETKTKNKFSETFTESIDGGKKVYTKDKVVVSTESYNIYNVVFAEDTDVLNDDTDASKYYFAIKKDDFKPQSKIVLSTKFVGIPLIHPFKFRSKTAGLGDELFSSVTVSYNFGFRFKLGAKDGFKQNFVSIVPYGFGFGADKYLKENTDGTVTEKKDAVAFTYYQGGVLFTVQKVNFGLFAGFDKMIGNKKDWVYQDRVWLSLGIGYKLGDY